MSPFLTARWINLLLASWVVDPSLLASHLPSGTSVDLYRQKAYVSLVAFEFRDTRVRGIMVPGHANFTELNLRFYVTANGTRGVVFIREYVPSPLIALMARLRYHEPYHSCSLTCRLEQSSERIVAQYAVARRGRRDDFTVEATPQSFMPQSASLEHFLKEHDRGYGRTRDGKTLAYQVTHAPWCIYPIIGFHHTADFAALYGERWSFLSTTQPANIMFAQGSEVTVFTPTILG